MRRYILDTIKAPARVACSKETLFALGAFAIIACGNTDSGNAGESTASAVAAPGSAAQPTMLQPAFVLGTAESSCMLHPEGDTDARDSVPLIIDADGVARFVAARPTTANSVTAITLDCTDPNGNAQTYSADLKSEATFAAHPFDPVRANLKTRPALVGDPLSFSEQELLDLGFDMHPDPDADQAGYARWLAAARVPAYQLRTASPSAAAHAAPKVRKQAAHHVPTSLNSGHGTVSDTVTRLAPETYAYWDGYVLSGAYAAPTAKVPRQYVSALSTWTVPGISTNAAAGTAGYAGSGWSYVSIWNGLDNCCAGVNKPDGSSQPNLFQAELWVQTFAGSSVGSYSLSSQDFISLNSLSASQLPTYSPQPGDVITSHVYYCDSKGAQNINGGYACTMMNVTSSSGALQLSWNCTQSSGSGCPSYQTDTKLVPTLGQQADFIMENDDAEQNNPALPYNQNTGWPNFTAPVVMSASTIVVNSDNTKPTTLTTLTDPNAWTWTDNGSNIQNENTPAKTSTGGVQWNIAPVTLGSGSLKNKNAAAKNMCLGLTEGSGGSPVLTSTPAVLSSCQTTGVGSDQNWKLTGNGFLVETLSGLCLDVNGWSSTDMKNGSNVHTSSCEFSGFDTGGNPTDQQWTLTSAGFLENQLSAEDGVTPMCVDVNGDPGVTAGLAIQLWTCESSGLSATGHPTDQEWAWACIPMTITAACNLASVFPSCGNVGDGCGGTINCGTCGNICKPPPKGCPKGTFWDEVGCFCEK